MNDRIVYVDEVAPFDWGKAAEAFRKLTRNADAVGGMFVKVGEASRECAESYRRFSRALRYSKRAVQSFRTFHGRLPRGWRKHVRRMKAETRRARG